MKSKVYGYIYECELEYMKKWHIPLIQWYHKSYSRRGEVGYEIHLYTPCSEEKGTRGYYCSCQLKNKKRKDCRRKDNCKEVRVLITAEVLKK